MQRVVVTALCVCMGLLAPRVCASLVTSTGRINPGLDPTSDKTFFKKDYPDDTRPSVADHFDHPFPTVQDSGDFAKDFVKDDNGDGGEWKAQETYDRLRMRVSEEKTELQTAVDNEHQKEADLQSAAEQESVSEAAAKEAEAQAIAAGDAHGKTQGEADKAKDAVADGTATVEKEVSDLEDCQKQLKDAKEKLAALEAAEKKASSDKNAAISSAQAAKEAAVEKKVAAEQQKASTETAEVAAEHQEEDLEKTVAQETAEHDTAVKSYEEEKEEAAQTRKDLDAAKERLRKFRKDVDADGGVYRSGAWGLERRCLGTWLMAIVVSRAAVALHL